MPELLMRVCDVSKIFPGVIALDNVSFDIRKGQVHALVGENGAGKSTLMNVLSGVYHPTDGKIFWKGKEIRIHDAREAQQLGIAMIHQELSLAPHLSVMENVYMGRLADGSFGFVRRGRLREKCGEQLRRVGLPAELADARVSDLSVSQQQMVEIAKALSLEAELLIMDEPTSSLTEGETGKLLQIIDSLRGQGMAMVFISHRMEEVFKISDIITVLRDGKGIESIERERATVPQVLSLMVGREFTGAKARKNCTKTERPPILEVKGLSYKNRVKNVSFNLYPSEVLVITGLVGAGRTELVECIMGARRKTAGEVRVHGQPIKGKAIAHMMRHGLAIVAEGRKIQGIFPRLSVNDNLRISALKKYCRSIFIRPKASRQAVQGQIDGLRIKTPSLRQMMQFLSGGNQQKVIFGRCLLCDPKIIILDEPTNGIDVGAKQEIYKLIDELARSGVSVICISSELPEVLTLADRVLVMHEGRITGDLQNKGLDQQTIMHYATKQREKESIN